MTESELDSPIYSPADGEASRITMLEGGKVLFDEAVGLQPVKLVEVPIKRRSGNVYGRANRYR